MIVQFLVQRISFKRFFIHQVIQFYIYCRSKAISIVRIWLRFREIVSCLGFLPSAWINPEEKKFTDNRSTFVMHHRCINQFVIVFFFNFLFPSPLYFVYSFTQIASRIYPFETETILFGKFSWKVIFLEI